MGPAVEDIDAVPMGGPESPAYLWRTGEHDRALKVGQRDLAVFASFGSFAGTVVVNLPLGQIQHSLGDYARALDFLQRSAAALKGELRHERFDIPGLPSVLARAWLAFCLGELGELAGGARHAEEGMEIATAAAHPYSLIVACAGLGNLYLVKGDLPRAIAALERGLVLAQVESIPPLFPLVASPLGSAYALAGRVVEGVSLQERAVDQAVAMKLLANHPLRLVRLGEAHLCAGAEETALPLARQALDLAREHGERGHEAHALRLLGGIARRARSPRAEEAEDFYGQALALAKLLGMRPLRAHCHLGLGALYRQTGRFDPARAELDAAADLLRSMEMTFWLPLTELISPNG